MKLLTNTKFHTNKKVIKVKCRTKKNTTLFKNIMKKRNGLPQIQYLLEIGQNPAAEALPTAGIE